MKTGEEKFDEEIRQKLGQSEVPPPPGFFDQIIPPSDKRKGFFWRWFSGIVLLGLTAGMMKYMESNDIERNYSEIKKNRGSLNPYRVRVFQILHKLYL